LSNINMSAPPVANFCTSAAAASPSAAPKALWIAAMLSKLSVATRCMPLGPAGEATAPRLENAFVRRVKRL
jgi:hypothetical protein